MPNPKSKLGISRLDQDGSGFIEPPAACQKGEPRFFLQLSLWIWGLGFREFG